MNYVDITARLKLREVGERNPEGDLKLCNSLQDEIEALLDRLHKYSRAGEFPDFDIDQPPLVIVTQRKE